ncbi:hypothetical protein [Lysobacter sp. CA199]|uniref:hypothetical protein n=1 Tax=Lysobacter sp. CA199 TaxID=3455608 RepID=UPI003F8D1C1B
MSESSEDAVYPTVWEAVPPAGGVHHHEGRNLRRKLSKHVWESRVVWPGDPLYPEPIRPATRTAATTAASVAVVNPAPARMGAPRFSYVLPMRLNTTHPYAIN